MWGWGWHAELGIPLPAPLSRALLLPAAIPVWGGRLRGGFLGAGHPPACWPPLDPWCQLHRALLHQIRPAQQPHRLRHGSLSAGTPGGSFGEPAGRQEQHPREANGNANGNGVSLKHSHLLSVLKQLHSLVFSHSKTPALLPESLSCWGDRSLESILRRASPSGVPGEPPETFRV